MLFINEGKCQNCYDEAFWKEIFTFVFTVILLSQKYPLLAFCNSQQGQSSGQKTWCFPEGCFFVL